jgi:nucleotide-binding universal stress UspA family protein
MSDEKTATNIITIIDSGPILVALDFTADSEAALLWGCNYADCVGASVIGLHVVHDPGDAPGYYRRVRGEHPEMETLKSVETVLVKGIPPTRILEIAKSKGARLIVMGSRGRTGLPHLLLGSKAERVVQLAPVPVTIVKAKNHGS